jgi:ribosomal protein S18 acetylase RimI-like enzyme
MKIKIFNGKKIKIRKLLKKDLKKVKKFQDFINSFIEEDAQITLNKKVSLKEEKEWLIGHIKNVIKRKSVFLFAEDSNKIIGTTEISLGKNRQEHIGNFGITIRKGYRGIGLGKYLIGEIIKLAKKELKPRPKIIRLGVFPINQPALQLYRKMGFKKVARIPKQIQYKRKLIDEIIMLLYL